MRYRARAPLRIDFGGGWTDVPFYALEHGGAVLNAAITRYAHGSIGVGPLSATRRWLSRPARGVRYDVDAPPGSGLGTSAAQNVLWVTLVKTTIANVSSRPEIAEIACQVGELLGIVGGKQDEYASALGGIHYFSFNESVEAERLDVMPSLAEELRSRLVLVYSGESRISGSIHDRVWERYRNGERQVHDALAELRRLAGDMRETLVSRDFSAFGPLLSRNWECQTLLDESISTSRLDAIMASALRAGASGGKVCGAGGGGCLVFSCEPERRDPLAAALARQNLDVLDFDFDTYGVYLTKG
jgi:D-glycero-alpha-D-manno-heptose-7-phosphate kinase